MGFSGKKEEFLSRNSNKQKLINMIAIEMKERGYKVIHAFGDADVPIARAVVEASVEQVTTVIGEATDLLLLLFFLEGKGLYFKIDLKQITKLKCLTSSK